MANTTKSILDDILSRRGYSIISPGPVAGIPSAQPESSDRLSSDGFRWAEGQSPEGAEDLSQRARYRVEVVLYTTRPQDSDNPFIKALVDQLRYHGLIPNDDPYSASTSVRQVRVKKRNQEGTKLIIRQIT